MKQLFARNIHFIYALVVATAYIFYHGYSFSGGDQEEHLPLVYKMFDAALYKYDYYVSQETFTFSIRQFYVYIVYAFSKVLGVETACFLLFFLSMLLISYSFVKITALFTAEKYMPFFAPLIFLLFYNEWTVGGNYFVLPTMICSVFAMAICSFAFLQFFKKNFYTAFICIGIAGLFQIIIALHVVVIALTLLTFDEGTHKKFSSVKCFFLFLLFSSPMLLPVLKQHFLVHGKYNTDYYYRILYYFRNPNHYLPSYFFPRDYARFFLLSFIGFAAAWLFKLINRKQLFAVYALVYGGALIYFVLLEKFHFYPIGKVQWFRATVWITAFSSLFMVIAAGKIITAAWKKIKFSDRVVVPLLIGEVIMAIIICNSEKIPLSYFKGKYEIGARVYSDLSKMHFWISENTAKDAVILTLPSDVSFLCEARRSTPVGYCAVIHEAFFMIPWYEKFQKIYGVNINDVGKLASAKDAAVKKYPRYKFKDANNTFNITYRLDNVKVCGYVNQLGEMVHREGDYVLTKMN